MYAYVIHAYYKEIPPGARTEVERISIAGVYQSVDDANNKAKRLLQEVYGDNHLFPGGMLTLDFNPAEHFYEWWMKTCARKRHAIKTDAHGCMYIDTYPSLRGQGKLKFFVERHRFVPTFKPSPRNPSSTIASSSTQSPSSNTTIAEPTIQTTVEKDPIQEALDDEASKEQLSYEITKDGYITGAITVGEFKRITKDGYPLKRVDESQVHGQEEDLDKEAASILQELNQGNIERRRTQPLAETHILSSTSNQENTSQAPSRKRSAQDISGTNHAGLAIPEPPSKRVSQGGQIGSRAQNNAVDERRAAIANEPKVTGSGAFSVGRDRRTGALKRMLFVVTADSTSRLGFKPHYYLSKSAAARGFWKEMSDELNGVYGLKPKIKSIHELPRNGVTLDRVERDAENVMIGCRVRAPGKHWGDDDGPDVFHNYRLERFDFLVEDGFVDYGTHAQVTLITRTGTKSILIEDSMPAIQRWMAGSLDAGIDNLPRSFPLLGY
ncbi:hypothetical protein BJ508DRAFT_410390 [Ascobolus immersus RN42]|uniref:Uncharacterized protein n=1 Tax=Ascobolus immersus RN42 TaxID=1160509 RepID=A0A3N4ITV0_ASCIM|nr:hypothetical protein BJ508DRAFT_410390 [Ascobolus immersus RN42]